MEMDNSKNIIIEIDERGRISYIDYLKGFSILTIVLFHLIQEYMTASPTILIHASVLGGAGIHVFIFCSGLGLYYSQMKNNYRVKEFIARRIKRIYIPYIVVVSISFLLPYMYSDTDRITALLSHVFLFKMFVEKYEESLGFQFWFISTIIQLYILFIPLCALIKRIGAKLLVRRALAVSIIWAILISVLSLDKYRIWNGFCLQYLWEFVLGMSVAEYIDKKRKIAFKYQQLLLGTIFGLGIYACMAKSWEVLRMFNDIPAFLGYTSMALLLSRINIIRRLGKFISRFSYELYLVHVLVFATAWWLIHPRSFIAQSVVGVISLFVALMISFVWNDSKKGIIWKKT